jgi:hypothetical protein
MIPVAKESRESVIQWISQFNIIDSWWSGLNGEKKEKERKR